MTSRTSGRSPRALRLLGALAGLSVVLGACNQTDGIVTAERSRRLSPASSDRGEEANRSIVDFRRPRPRRPVGAAARRRHRTGADMGPRRNRLDRRRRAGRHAECARRGGRHTGKFRALLAAGGVPSRAIILHHYRPDDPAPLPTIRLSYPRIAAVAGPCGLWPEDLGPSINNPTITRTSRTTISAAPPSAISRR